MNVTRPARTVVVILATAGLALGAPALPATAAVPAANCQDIAFLVKNVDIQLDTFATASGWKYGRADYNKARKALKSPAAKAAFKKAVMLARAGKVDEGRTAMQDVWNLVTQGTC